MLQQNIRQWWTMTMDMMVEINMEMTMTILLQDQDLMVWSSIQSPRLGITEKDRSIDGDVTTDVAHYISTLLKMCHKLLYMKFVIFDWFRCHTK